MKNLNWKSDVLPHVVIIAIFLGLTFFFLSPLLQGKILYQSDIIQYKGMSKEITDYRNETGRQPLWTNRPFAGMPCFLISTDHKTNILRYVDQVISFSMDYINYNYRPAKILFLMFLGFYIGCMFLRQNKWLSVIGATAFALSTFFIVSLEAGHNTKILTTAYLLPVIAAILFAYRRNALWGAFLLAVSLGLSINSNHVQITYYAFLVGLVIFISELVFAVKEKTIAQFAKASMFLAVGAMLAVSLNAGRLLTTYQHTKETIRGQATALSNTEKAKNNDGGLDYEYAMSWSYGISETLTTMIPNFAGGASGGALSENSATYETLLDNRMSKSQARKTIQQLPLYFGKQPFTGGPTYFGAVICFLFVLALLLLPWRQKVWAIAAVLLSLFLAWGKYSFISDVFFNYFPLYNKFRTPMMALTIAGVVFPLLAVMGLNNLFIKYKEWNKKELLKKLYIATGVMGGICLLAILAGGLFWDFRSTADAQLPDWLIGSIISDRKSLLRNDAFRSLVFILLSAGAIWLFIKEKVKAPFIMAGLGLLTLIDMGMVTKRYLNNDDFVSQREIDKSFVLNPAAQQLKKEPGNFRVFNTQKRLDSDGITPYTLNTLGGYSGAKLTRYQDLIDQQITKGNSNVLNMLNAKYVIGGEGKVSVNDGACGTAWLSNSVIWASDADDEMAKLNDFDACIEVILNERYQDQVGTLDGTGGNIELIKNDLDYLEYEVNSNNNQIAVFSEIYYKAGGGWQATINGEPIEVLQANYTLRALVMPPGKHKVEFRFNPAFYKTGESISLASSVLLLLALGGLIFFQRKQNLKLDESE